MRIQIKDNRWAECLNDNHFPMGEDIEVVEITKEELKQFIIDNKPEKTYVELRKEAYGSWQEQLEMINEQGMEAWQKHIVDVKAKYPKPEEKK